MTQEVEIKLKFRDIDKNGCSISIMVDGKDADIVTMEDSLKYQCIKAIRKWADILEEEIYK